MPNRLMQSLGLGLPFGRRSGAEPAVESRTVESVPWNYGGSLVSPGLTQDRALALAPVFAATRIIAGTVSTLPLKAYRRIGDDRQPMGSLPQLFQQLADTGRLVGWLHECVVSLVLRGNAYGFITARDGFGFPTQIVWLNPSDIDCDDSKSTIRPTWRWMGREIPAEDLVHIPWFKVAGKVQALTPIGAFASTINTGLYAQAYGSDWFEGGGFPPGSFQNTEQPVVNQVDADNIKARLVSAIRSRQPIVYGKDWEYKPITVPPNEAQFVETMRLSATQIANIYGLPPEDIGGQRGNSLTYTTVELNQLERVLAVREWLVVLEHAFAALLPDRQYVRFTADAVVRADIKTRWQVYATALGVGAMNIDEVRALEDMPPLPNGEGQTYAVGGSPPVGADQVLQGLTATDSQNPQRMWRVPA